MADFQFRCTECAAVYAEGEVALVCPRCAAAQVRGEPIRGVLDVELATLPSEWPAAAFSSAEFLTAFLPIPSGNHLAPLPVGGTPLLDVPGLRERLGTPRLWLKDDTRNPSGSTKDRASLLVVAKAVEHGHTTVAAASTGNAATALAAVGAAAGIHVVVFVPASAPDAKLIQMLSYGATVLRIEGTYDDAFELSAEACERFGWYNRNTALNPFTAEGKKTAAIEIAAQLAPECPDVVVVPTGDGVILAGIAKGFADLVRCGLIDRSPRLVAVQPDGAAAIVHALHAGADTVTPVRDAHSVADSLTVEAPRNALQCLRAIRSSRGSGVTVSDDAIVAAIGELARYTGVFAEPAAAATLAGFQSALAQGVVDRDERVVLLVTGSGLKDIPSARRGIRVPEPIQPDIDALSEHLRETESR